MMKDNHELYLSFGLRVKIIREVKGLTQAEFAKKVGLSRGSVANIETGRQKVLLDTVVTFARVLKVKPSRLIGDFP